MSKARLLFTIVIFTSLAFLIQIISGFVLWVVLSRGGGGGRLGDGGTNTFIWNRHTWIDIHDWTAVALLVFIAIHIYMHWKWLYNQIKSLLKSF